MKTGKNRVKGLKSELFKKYQTDPVVLNPSSQNNIPSWGQPEVTPLITNIEDIYKGYDPYNTQYAQKEVSKKVPSFDLKATSMLQGIQEKDKENFFSSNITGPVFPYQNIQADVKGGTEPVTKEDEKNLTIGQTTSTINDGTKPKETYTWKDYTRMGLGMLDTALSLNEDVKNRNEMNRRIRETNDIPRYDANYYQFAGRPGSQKTIFAKEGAEIRTGTETGAEEAELERGEYFILPDGDEYAVGGKKHSQGGEKFVLPEGTIVFSDYLKIPGTGKTFAQEARKYPLDKYSEVLKNQHAKSVDRNTAQILYDRNSKKLMQLFQMQQAMNGNSSGELKEEVQGKRGMLYGQAGLYNSTNSQLETNTTIPSWATASTQVQETTPLSSTNMSEIMDITPDDLASSMSTVFDKVGLNEADKRTEYIAKAVDKATNLTSQINQSFTGTQEQSGDISPYTKSNSTVLADGTVKPKGVTPEQAQKFVDNVLSGVEFANKNLAKKTKEELTKELQIKAAAKIDANSKTTTGADKSLNVPVNTTTNNLKKGANPDESGTVTDGNASDNYSRHWTKVVGPGGVEKKVWKEGQGQWAGKSLKEQYADNPILLLRNRVNENYGVLSPRLLDAYKGQLKNKNLAAGKVEDMLDVLEGGNNSLIKFREFFTQIGRDAELFDPMLDRAGKGGENKNQEKTLALFKEYIESNQFKEAVDGTTEKPGNAALLNIPWIKGKIVKDAKGNYTLEQGASIDKDFSEKYQAAYRAIGAVKKQQPKDKDLLKGFRINPEGLADQMWLGLPISPTDRWTGNTTIGQIVGFEDEEFKKKKEEPPSPDVVTTSPGGPVPGKVGPVPQGSYEKAIFDIAQLAPEFYGLANSEIFPYVPFDYNAPYVMPQTLNIQPQLQDIDNSYVAALRAGADPNAAFISSLNAKQRIYSEKQNFDAQQRAAADQQNAQYRWQEDVQDINSLDRVYNTLIAQADDARTSQIQDIVRSATQKRNVWNFEENRKKLYIDNFVRNYNWDGNTGQATLSNPQGYDPFNIAMTAEMLNAAYGIKPTTKTTTTTSKTATEPSKTTTTVTTTAEEEKKKKEAAKK